MTSVFHVEELRIVRDDSANKDFQTLVQLLDRDLLARYGHLQDFFDQFNGLEEIKHVVVAYMDNKPVGCGAMKKYNEACMEIKRMFVKQECRGRGIAKEILHELERWAVEQQFTCCVLETGKEQPEAVSLYQKIGYTLIENYGQYIGIDISVCMRKEFTYMAGNSKR